jgi:hypothetical protein
MTAVERAEFLKRFDGAALTLLGSVLDVSGGTLTVKLPGVRDSSGGQREIRFGDGVPEPLRSFSRGTAVEINGTVNTRGGPQRNEIVYLWSAMMESDHRRTIWLENLHIKEAKK